MTKGDDKRRESRATTVDDKNRVVPSSSSVLLSRGSDYDNYYRPSSWREKFQDFTDDNLSNVASLFLPGTILKTIAGAIVTLYILNQQHLLPKPLSAVVSKTLFWPTLPITVARRIGKWSTVIDDTVIIGGAPFGFIDYPERLYEDYGVSFILPPTNC